MAFAKTQQKSLTKSLAMAVIIIGISLLAVVLVLARFNQSQDISSKAAPDTVLTAGDDGLSLEEDLKNIDSANTDEVFSDDEADLESVQ